MTDFDLWPDCAVPGCRNKVCLRLNSKYCWGHTPGIMTEEVAEALREQTESREAADCPLDKGAGSS